MAETRKTVPTGPAYDNSDINAQKPGYQFLGWYVDEERTKRLNPGGRLPKVMTIYDKWAPIWYPVHYELAGGENDSRNPALISVESQAIELHPAVKEGKIFTGWIYNGQKIQTLPQGVAHPITLKASFRVPYRIHLNTNGGGRLESITAQADNRLPQLPKPGRVGFVFEGWYMDKDLKQKVPEPAIVHSDCTLHAKWKPAVYSIVYDTRQGLNSRRNPSSFTYMDPDIPLYPAVRKGYKFLGWQDERGHIAEKIPARSIGNRSFTALWEKNGA